MTSSYILTKPNNFINVAKIVTIHYLEFDRTFTSPGEQHDFWEIVYVDSGEIEVRRDEETLLLKQGEILFHQPNEFHALKSHNSCPNVFIIYFVCKSTYMASFKKYRTVLNKNLKPFIASIIDEANNTYIIPKNDTLLKKLILKKDAPIGGEQLIKTYLEQFLILLARETTMKRSVTVFPYKENLESQLVRDIKEYIKSKLTTKLCVNDICVAFGYSKTYLCQLFKSQCSISLMKYYNVKKIEYAKKLIRENSHNLTQISNYLCFDNPQYFSRVFKRETGLTPSEFINSLGIND